MRNVCNAEIGVRDVVIPKLVCENRVRKSIYSLKCEILVVEARNSSTIVLVSECSTIALHHSDTVRTERHALLSGIVGTEKHSGKYCCLAFLTPYEKKYSQGEGQSQRTKLCVICPKSDNY